MPSLFVRDANGNLVPNNNLTGDNPGGGDGSQSAGDSQTADSVNTKQAQTSASGIGGFFGAKDDYAIYRPADLSDPNYQDNKQKLANAISDTKNLGAPTMRQVDVAPAAQSAAQVLPADVRMAQMQLANQLQNQAAGIGPTLSDQQFKTDTDRGMAQALAMAASARGVNPAMAARQAADSQAQIQGQAAAQQFTNSQQEQMNARQQLSGVLSGVGSQDTANAGLAQQNSQFNAGATNTVHAQQAQIDQAAAAATFNGKLDMEKFKASMVQQYLSMGMSLDQANFQATLQQRQFSAGLLAQETAAQHGVSIQNNAQSAQVAGSALNAIGTAAAAALA